MRGWKKISDFPRAEQNKLRWIVRHATQNGIVEAGVAVRYGNAWTINEEAEMERLIELGIDGLVTDHPGRMVELLARRGAA